MRRHAAAQGIEAEILVAPLAGYKIGAESPVSGALKKRRKCAQIFKKIFVMLNCCLFPQGSCIYFFHVKIPLKATYFEEKIYRNGEEGEEGGEKENLSAKPSSTYSPSW